MGEPPLVVREYTNVLADALANAAAELLFGVYLHGSAVLGDWSAPASDVDVLVVVRDGMSTTSIEQLATALRVNRPCPGLTADPAGILPAPA